MSGPAPEISLVIPIFNGAAFLEEALASVRRQAFTDFELIVWDDGSTDDSMSIAARHAEADERIRLAGGAHLGVGGALACGHELARGCFVGYLDQDDRLSEQALSATRSVLLERPSLGMVYTDHLEMSADGVVGSLGRRCSIPFSPENLLVDFMTFHLRLIRASVYRAIGGFRPEFGQAADYDLCLRLSEVASVAHLREPHYFYRVHPGSLSQRRGLQQREDAARAVRSALARRKLDTWVELVVEPDGAFRLAPRTVPRD